MENRKFSWRWRSARALEEKIRAYFRSCEEGERHPSVTGLSLALGFTGRQELEQYAEGRQEGEEAKFVRALRRAQARIEDENLQALYRRDTSAGARFVLQNGFGYSDRRELGFSGVINVKIVDDSNVVHDSQVVHDPNVVQDAGTEGADAD